MPRPAAEILEEARQLPPHMQRWLAKELLDQEQSEPADLVEAAWADEIKRRLHDIDSGAVKMIPLEEVIQRMEARLIARRGR